MCCCHNWEYYRKNEAVANSNHFTYFLQHCSLDHQFNMFHVFALAYLTTVFLWPTLLFFHCFASHKREPVHCTTAHARCKCVYIISFLKLFTSTPGRVGHETFSSSWSCDKSFFFYYFDEEFSFLVSKWAVSSCIPFTIFITKFCPSEGGIASQPDPLSFPSTFELCPTAGSFCVPEITCRLVCKMFRFFGHCPTIVALRVLLHRICHSDTYSGNLVISHENEQPM